MDVSMENKLSDNQRRTICRVLFLLVCALPTLATIYFATHQRSADEWAQLIQAELGVKTDIGVVETPRPDEVIFHHVKFYDNVGKAIFESPKAKITFGNTNKVKIQNAIRIQREGLSHFLKEASGRLVLGNTDLKSWDVEFADLQIVDGPDPNFENQPFHLQSVTVQITSRGKRRLLSVAAPGLGAIGFSRNPGDTDPEEFGQFEVVINATQHPVPCWLAKDWFPQLKQLGKHAHYAGVAEVNSRGGWSNSSLTGNFVGINLPYFDDSAKRIFVNGLQLEDKNLKDGQAIAVLGDDRQVDLTVFLRQPAEPIANPFNEVMRRASLEVLNSTVRR